MRNDLRVKLLYIVNIFSQQISSTRKPTTFRVNHNRIKWNIYIFLFIQWLVASFAHSQINSFVISCIHANTTHYYIDTDLYILMKFMVVRVRKLVSLQQNEDVFIGLLFLRSNGTTNWYDFYHIV